MCTCASFQRRNLRFSDVKVVLVPVFILTHKTCNTYNTCWTTNTPARIIRSFSIPFSFGMRYRFARLLLFLCLFVFFFSLLKLGFVP